MLLTPDGLPRLIQRVRLDGAAMVHFVLFAERTITLPLEEVARTCNVPLQDVVGLLQADDPTPLYDTMDEWVLRHWFPVAPPVLRAAA